MSIAKTLRQKRATVIENARALISKENATSEDHAAFDTAMAEADQIMAQVERIEKADALDADLKATLDRKAIDSRISLDQAHGEAELERDAFLDYGRFGIAAMDETLRQHLRPVAASPGRVRNIGIGSGGGATLIPTLLYGQIVDVMKQYGPILDTSTVIRTAAGEPISVPVVDDTSNEGELVAEGDNATVQDVSVSAVTLGAYNYSSKVVKVSRALLQDSAFDFQGWLVQALGRRLGRIIGKHGTTGTGTDQPKGIVTGSTLGKTGASGQVTSFTYEDLVDLETSLDPAYWSQAGYMFQVSVYRALRKMKDDENRPLWQASIATGTPDTINGKPFTLNQSMPAMAASAKSILFGQLDTFAVRLVQGMPVRRLDELYALGDQVGFIGWQRADADQLDSSAIKHYAHPAS